MLCKSTHPFDTRNGFIFSPLGSQHSGSVCGWAKSISRQIETTLEIITFVGIYIGGIESASERLSGFWISRHHPRVHRRFIPPKTETICAVSTVGSGRFPTPKNRNKNTSGGNKDY